jgi:hypothetical protein
MATPITEEVEKAKEDGAEAGLKKLKEKHKKEGYKEGRQDGANSVVFLFLFALVIGLFYVVSNGKINVWVGVGIFIFFALMSGNNNQSK